MCPNMYQTRDLLDTPKFCCRYFSIVMISVSSKLGQKQNSLVHVCECVCEYVRASLCVWNEVGPLPNDKK